MNILVLDEEFPFPLNSGKRIRSFNLLSRLAKRHELSYLAYGTEASESYQALLAADMHPIPVHHQLQPKSGPLFYAKLLLNLLSPLPYTVASHFTRPFADQLLALLNRKKFDIVICEWSPYAIYMRDLPMPPTVIVAHNLEHLIWQRYHQTETSFLKKLYIGGQYRKMLKFEKAAFDHAAGVTTVSQKEADGVRALSGTPRVVPVDNGVDLAYFAPAQTQPKADSMVFVGSLDWRPNQDAVEYFIEEIMPKIRQRRPNAMFSAIGRNMPPHIAKLGDRPGVNLVGEVADVRPYAHAASVFVVPLRIGGGTRLKILEALAMESAVVSTTIGAEGLELENNRHLLIADSPAQFADTVVSLLEDPTRAKALGKAGRTRVEERYGWDKLAVDLEHFLNQMVEPR
ncbi:MAG: glycosyltransferase [bacterium]|nr:glycosyltransferase [bacterium]